jgi:hypothetical protein
MEIPLEIRLVILKVVPLDP